MFRFCFAAIAAAILSQCAPPGDEGISPNPFNLLEQQAGPENYDKSRISIALLHSKELAKRWGKPTTLVGPHGGYGLLYRNPRNRNEQMVIYGTAKRYKPAGPLPPSYTDLRHDPATNTFKPEDVSQIWSLVTLNNRPVRYCIVETEGANERIYYATETVRLTAPDGREASYRIGVSLARPDAAKAEQLLGTAGF